MFFQLSHSLWDGKSIFRLIKNMVIEIVMFVDFVFKTTNVGKGPSKPLSLSLSKMLVNGSFILGDAGKPEDALVMIKKVNKGIGRLFSFFLVSLGWQIEVCWD